MPTINVFAKQDSHVQQLKNVINELKSLTAKELSCADITLKPDEISVRILKAAGEGMLADIELEITAHGFTERITRQDEICLNIRRFLKDTLQVSEIRVWLMLAELGHSWE